MTSRFSTTVSVCFTTVLILSGCSSSPAVKVGSTVVSFDDVIANADRQVKHFRSLQAEGNLQVESPSFSQSASFEVLVRRPDSLQIDFQGPFGIKVGSALVTRSGFQFYSSLQNKLFVGPTSPENLEKAFNISLTFDDILSLFTGGSVLLEDRNSRYSTQADGSDAIFLFTSGPFQRRYVIDPATKAIRKLQILNSRGVPVGEQSFAAFETADGITYPRRITLTQHAARRRLTLYYESVEWNPATPVQFTFSVPSTAERVDLQ